MRVRSVLSICLSCILPASALAAVSAAPDQVHFSWQNDPATTISAVWRTDAASTGTLLEYGIGSLTDSVQGYTYSYPGGEGIMHVAEATGLTPNSVYQVRVGDGAGHVSGIEQIATAPAPDDLCQPYSFIVMGDSRSTIGEGVSILWPTLLDVAADQAADFILFNGDAIAEGDSQSGWNDFFEPGDIAAAPFLPTWGNHEDRGGSKYLQQHVLPINSRTNTEDFYSLRYGNALILMLDTEHGASQYLAQQDWLHEQLGGSDALWTFALNHRPAYSSGTTHGSEPEVQQYLVPLYDLYHVDAAFGSHDHMYERTCPIKDGREVSPEEGTVYFVSGGAGAFVNPIGGFAWFTEKFLGMMHVILVEVNFDRVSFTVLDASEIVLDTYQIFKPGVGAPTAAFSVNPLPARSGEPVSFDASASVDPCGEPVDYHWQFGDGGQALGKLATHVYDEPGPVTVVLTVTDADQQTDTVTQDLDVLPGPGDDDDSADDDDATYDDDSVGDDDDDDAGCCG